MAPDGLISLNDSGMEIATRIYRRHKTLTKLFTILGVSEEIAAEDACKVEHDGRRNLCPYFGICGEKCVNFKRGLSAALLYNRRWTCLVCDSAAHRQTSIR